MEKTSQEAYRALWEERNALRDQNQLLWELVEKLRIRSVSDKLGLVSEDHPDTSQNSSTSHHHSPDSSDIEREYRTVKSFQSKIDKRFKSSKGKKLKPQSSGSSKSKPKLKPQLQQPELTKSNDDSPILVEATYQRQDSLEQGSKSQRSKDHGTNESNSISKRTASKSRNDPDSSSIKNLDDMPIVPIPQRSNLRKLSEDEALDKNSKGGQGVDQRKLESRNLVKEEVFKKIPEETSSDQRKPETKKRDEEETSMNSFKGGQENGTSQSKPALKKPGAELKFSDKELEELGTYLNSSDKAPQLSPLGFQALEKYIQATSSPGPSKLRKPLDKANETERRPHNSIKPIVTTFNSISPSTSKSEPTSAQNVDSSSDTDSLTSSPCNSELYEVDNSEREPHRKLSSSSNEMLETFTQPGRAESVLLDLKNDHFDINDGIFHSPPDRSIEKAIEKSDDTSDTSSISHGLSRDNSQQRRKGVIPNHDIDIMSSQDSITLPNQEGTTISNQDGAVTSNHDSTTMSNQDGTSMSNQYDTTTSSQNGTPMSSQSGTPMSSQNVTMTSNQEPPRQLPSELSERLEILRKRLNTILVTLIPQSPSRAKSREFEFTISGQPPAFNGELKSGNLQPPPFQKLWVIEKTWDQIVTFEAQLLRLFPVHLTNIPLPTLPTWGTSNQPPPMENIQDFINSTLKLPIDINSDTVGKFLATNLVSTGQTLQTTKTEKKKPFKSGYLLKRGKKLGKLKLRYFVVSGSNLEYFESADGYHLGLINLSGANIVRSMVASLHSEVYENYVYAITVMEPRKGSAIKHVFFVDNPTEWDSWIQSLEYFSHMPPTPPSNHSVPPKELQQVKSNESLEARNEPALPPPPETNTKPVVDHDAMTFSPYPVTATSLAQQGKESPHSRQKSPDSISERTTGAKNPSNDTIGSSRGQRKEVDKALKSNVPVARKGFQWNGKLFGGFDFNKKHSGDNRIFGVPLDQAIAKAPIKKDYQMPAVIHRCIEYLEYKKAYNEEGIYRLSGSSADIQYLKDKFDNDGDFNLIKSGQRYDVHTVAGLLKLYLREMPTYVLTQNLQPEFVKVTEFQNRSERINELGRLVCALPLAHYTLLRTLVAHLIRVVEKAEINKMTLRNVAIVFVPTLAIPAGVFNLMFIEFEFIFYVNEKGDAEPKQLELTRSSSTNNYGTARVRNDGRDRRNSTLYRSGAPETFVTGERNLVIAEEEIPEDDFLYDEEDMGAAELLERYPEYRQAHHAYNS